MAGNIKRGIMEMADLLPINKAEERTKQAAKIAREFNRGLHLYRLLKGQVVGIDNPKVLCNALLEILGIEEIIGRQFKNNLKNRKPTCLFNIS